MNELKWWQKSVFYQIYPRSFADSNGDGIGDLPGITQKLDYLQDLGIDAIWLSPQYPSPLWDCGYDISDYYAIAPEYGSLQDFQEMLASIHGRGMHLVLDLVLNHTSNQHYWFHESRSAKNNPKRDWYIWRDGQNGATPNNWYSTFGGSAWELDPVTDQYYYHFFFKEQPDLNWRNQEVRNAMFDMMRFWMDMGVDGFRLDAIGTIFENPDLPNQEAPMNQAELYRLTRTASTPAELAWVNKMFHLMFKHQHDLPEIHELMRELRKVSNEYDNQVLVGESDLLEYYGNGQDELHLNFNFPLMKTDRMTPEWVRENQRIRLGGLPDGAWPCNTLGNHDSPRLASHFGDGMHNREISRLLLALMLTLKGTPFLYNGEEIGMTDLRLSDIHQFRDMMGIWAYQTEIEQFGSSPEAALIYAARHTRDKCRTPMQWANQPNAGFCPAEVSPWLPVNPNYREHINVADQLTDPDSLLRDYRQLLHTRKQTPALISGDFHFVDGGAEGYLGYTRQVNEPSQICLIVLNMTAQSQPTQLEIENRPAKVVYSSADRVRGILDPAHLVLKPFEVTIMELNQS